MFSFRFQGARNFLNRYKPSSILQLTASGYLAMAALLVAAIIIMVKQLDALSDRSENLINTTANAMQSGSELIGQINAMERNARQYLVLKDDAYLAIYRDRRNNFIKTAESLSELNLNPEINADIIKLRRDENEIFKSLDRTPGDQRTISEYPKVLDQAYSVMHAVNTWINNQLIEQRMQTDRTRVLLTYQLILLIVIAIFLVGLFTVLVTRPLRQIERVINLLGSGRYDSPVLIHGPRDLQELGQRLDWLRNRLKDLEQQRTFFMRHISHELKTPLAAILEGTALLGEEVVGSITAEQNDIINILHKNCRRLRELIENLLRYNVESLAQLKPMPHPVRIEEVIGRVLSDHSLAIKSGGIRIVKNIQRTTVQADLEQIRVILDNLVSNAVKYSPQNGNIYISLRRDETAAELIIQDEGPGIPEQERHRVFEPYFQGHPPADKQLLDGTGLGLAITREYVEMSGGMIDILNVSRGCCICVRIPLNQGDKP